MEIRDVGDRALLFEFGAVIAPEINEHVVALDEALAAAPPAGLIETIPAFASLLVRFDPELTSRLALVEAVRAAAAVSMEPRESGRVHSVEVRYGGEDGFDLDEAAKRLGWSREAVIAAHGSVDLRVYMYGFAPGYAYLGGLPDGLTLPRKDSAVRGVPAGSVMIAAGQCLITTLPMPTGWWVIGRTDYRVLEPDSVRPFKFAVGDHVRFVAAPT